jgi:hypothetical protein
VIAVVMAVVNITDINQPRCNTIPILSEYRDFFLPVLLYSCTLNKCFNLVTLTKTKLL